MPPSLLTAALPSSLFQTSTSVTAASAAAVRPVAPSDSVRDSETQSLRDSETLTRTVPGRDIMWSESRLRDSETVTYAASWAVSEDSKRAGQACPVGPSLSGGLRASAASGRIAGQVNYTSKICHQNDQMQSDVLNRHFLDPRQTKNVTQTDNV